MTTIYSKDNVPFSWERKPGVSKITPTKNCTTGDFSPKLPPPPCPMPEKSKAAPKLPLPSPSPSKSSSRRIFKKRDYDPFYMAYKECTKSSRKGEDQFGFEMKNNKKKKKKNSISTFSCKKSCTVMENSISSIC
ncbi:unnamed protein product [Withania somnifera]